MMCGVVADHVNTTTTKNFSMIQWGAGLDHLLKLLLVPVENIFFMYTGGASPNYYTDIY